jgi:adenosylcobinamide kinase/adenosylcobinamide-phosphate guanylyltransferase
MSHKISLPPLTLVTGGAASGKSKLAEARVLGCGLSPVYIATAQAWDDEMRAKIARHRARRSGWREMEAPTDLPAALATLRPDEATLVDCLTLWLTNVMLARTDPAEATPALIAALQASQGPVVCVTNEVGQGIVPDTALGRRFREAQGHLNQRIAAQADSVVAVMAGLPLVLKGPAWT